MNPVRVLHVLGAMNRGGVETWLMHVLRRVPKAQMQMDLLLHSNLSGAYDSEALALGAKIFRCPYPQRPIAYAKRFREIIRESGPYDVLHSHVHHYSGLVLRLGRQAGIPERIAHSHNDLRTVAGGAGPLRKGYFAVSRRMIAAYCTRGLAASRPAATDLFGAEWERDGRFEILHCGVDLQPFQEDIDRDAARAEFGFRPNDLVFGHVGRFDPQKNHAFLGVVAAEIVRQEPKARFLLVGEGPLRPSIEAQMRQSGIGERVAFAGSRADVPRLMTAVMDRFLFPSHYEGLGLALIEAQAAGLPCTIADSVPVEATVIPDLVSRVSLQESAGKWAEYSLRPGTRKMGAVAEMQQSSFDIDASIRGLMRVYGVPLGVLPVAN